MTDLATLAVTFGDRLHASGLPVTPERSGRFAAAIALTAPATYDDLYWAARVTLVSGHEQLPMFDRVFGHVFGELADAVDVRGDPTAPPATRAPNGRRDRSDSAAPRAGGRSAGATESGRGDDAREGETLAMTASDEERLHRADFATLSPGELASLRALMAEMAVAPPPRVRRRRERHAAGRRLDVRATVRASHRTGGDPVQRTFRRPRERPRRVVLLADISGSMEPYARAYLQLLHSAVVATRAEAFVFATQLTRLTGPLRQRDASVALQRAAARAPDWSGGTRIGESLRAFNDGWGRRGLARGAVVVVVSDGWESGDATLVGREMERLARLAHRIVWVNPRRQSASYEPLVAGMRAALPHVDAFVSGHSAAAMREVLAAISG